MACTPVTERPEAWLGIYEQHVQPLLLSLRGEQVFHGGAIAVGDEAIAFLGDDCLHLDVAGPRVRMHPHADHVRLCEDSALALGEGEASYVPGSPKPRLQGGERLPHCARAQPLARLYLLGEADVEAPTIAPLSPSQALIGLTANAFVLDIKNPEVLKRNLRAAARLVGEVPIKRLDYPRRYDVLPAVVDAVLKDADG